MGTSVIGNLDSQVWKILGADTEDIKHKNRSKNKNKNSETESNSVKENERTSDEERLRRD